MSDEAQTQITIPEEINITERINLMIEGSIQTFRERFISSVKEELNQKEGDFQLGAMTAFTLQGLSVFEEEDLTGPLSGMYFIAGLGDALCYGEDFLKRVKNSLTEVFLSCNVNADQIEILLTLLFGKFRALYNAGLFVGEKETEKENR